MAMGDYSFKDITLDKDYIKVRIKLSVYDGRFKKAWEYMDKEVMRLMTPYVPYKTGEFLGKLKAINATKVGSGEITVVQPPQGRYLYGGISKSGKPFNWTNPQTQPMWGAYTLRTHHDEIVRGVRNVIWGK